MNGNAKDVLRIEPLQDDIFYHYFMCKQRTNDIIPSLHEVFMQIGISIKFEKISEWMCTTVCLNSTYIRTLLRYDTWKRLYLTRWKTTEESTAAGDKDT